MGVADHRHQAAGTALSARFLHLANFAHRVVRWGGREHPRRKTATPTEAVRNGRVDAMTADYPVTAYAAKNSAGQLEAAGELFKTAPYGWVVQKNSPLSQALQKALQHVMQTGDYKTVLANWQLQDGAVQMAAINGAAN